MIQTLKSALYSLRNIRFDFQIEKKALLDQ